MSQYGADTMAQNGQTAEQILAHYYPGTKLEKMNFCTK
jgi:stage II sporulation protein D